MKLRLIRNATMRLRYGDVTLLLDPYFAERHTLPSYRGGEKNPTVALPQAADDVVAGVDLLLVSHLHSDHFDAEARRLLAKDLPLLCQPPDGETLRGHGFSDVRPVADRLTVGRIGVERVDGRHGSGDTARLMGPVSGFVLRAAGEPVVYWAGDTVLTAAVSRKLAALRPAVIITHSGGAVWGAQQALIIMDAEQTIAVCQAQPQATVVAVHLEALDHCLVSRAALRQAADAAGIDPQRLRIPADGEELTLGA